VSSKLEDIQADVEIRFISVESGKEIKDKIVRRGLKVKANGTTDIMTGTIDNIDEEPHVLAARIWVNGEIVARDMDWPQPLKYLPFPKRNVKVDVRGDQMHVTVDRPVKCLVFEEREGCHLSDSAIDLTPGDEQIVTVRGLKKGEEPLTWTYLGAGEQ
jgi:beta-mannosidase